MWEAGFCREVPGSAHDASVPTQRTRERRPSLALLAIDHVAHHGIGKPRARQRRHVLLAERLAVADAIRPELAAPRERVSRRFLLGLAIALLALERGRDGLAVDALGRKLRLDRPRRAAAAPQGR